MNITPYDKNPKAHPKEQVELIARSIARFGWRQPIIVNRDNIIVVGHGRWMAYNEYKERLGIKEPWIVNDEGETISGEAETKPLSIKEEKAYRLADNQINALSGQDMELVKEEWEEIDDKDLQEITGFDSDLFVEKDDKDDEVPEIPETPISKIGDVYKLGNHIVMCGDSTNKDHISTLMGEVKADLVFTDPPYNVDYSGRGEKTSNKILNDKMTPEQFDEFLSQVFQRYAEVSKKGAAWYVFHSSSTQHQFQKAIESVGWKVKSQIIWNKPVASMGWGDYRWKHEPMFYCGHENTVFYGDRTNSSIWDFHKSEDDLVRWAKNQLRAEKEGITTIWTMKREPVGEYVHPTQKPVELISHALHNSSKPGDIVLDLFGGSGATMIACEKYNRDARIMELDPKYVDVIVSRYCKFVDNNTIIKNGEEIEW